MVEGDAPTSNVVKEISKLANLWIDLAATDSSSSQDTVEEGLNGVDDEL